MNDKRCELCRAINQPLYKDYIKLKNIDKNNFQLLCKDCFLGKLYNKDETDWREYAVRNAKV